MFLSKCICCCKWAACKHHCWCKAWACSIWKFYHCPLKNIWQTLLFRVQSLGEFLTFSRVFFWQIWSHFYQKCPLEALNPSTVIQISQVEIQPWLCNFVPHLLNQTGTCQPCRYKNKPSSLSSRSQICRTTSNFSRMNLCFTSDILLGGETHNFYFCQLLLPGLGSEADLLTGSLCRWKSFSSVSKMRM